MGRISVDGKDLRDFTADSSNKVATFEMTEMVATLVVRLIQMILKISAGGVGDGVLGKWVRSEKYDIGGYARYEGLV